MKTDFSKPAADIRQELDIRQATNRKQFERQRQASELLKDGTKRTHCLLCGAGLEGEHFTHRSLPFIQCRHCHHVQSCGLPPPGYPPLDFSTVYPRLTPDEYQDRKARIYQPKLAWALKALEEYGLHREQLAAMRWLEMGAGAGYFLSALQDAGFSRFAGLDADGELVKIARAFVNPDKVFVHDGDLASVLSEYPAEIYVAFFVLEHISEAAAFFEALGQLPRGTFFLFSVPVFGFSCLLENVFAKDYARNLDGVIHTQLYTDQSISHALNRADFQIIRQWVFGQDATDLIRLLISNLEGLYPNTMFEQIKNRCLPLQDPFQNCLDRQMLSDQRHIIAVKR